MTEFLEGLDPINVIPSYVQNFAEASMYVMESVDEDFFSVLENAGFVNEDGVLTEDTEVVSEGVKDLIDGAIDALKKLWSKIQGWFGLVLKWFDDQKKNVKDHLQKLVNTASDKTIGKINAAMLDKIKPDKKVGSYTTFDFDITKIKKAFNGIEGAVLSVGAGLDIEGQDAKLEEALGGATPADITANVKKEFVTSTNNKATVADIKGDFDSVIKPAVFGDKDKAAIKAAYTLAKKAIDDSIKNLKSAKAKGLKKNEDQKQRNAALAKNIAFCKKANKGLHAYHSAIVSLLRARFVQYAHIISVCVTSALAASAKAKLPKKKAKGEAEAATESVTLESLFEW